MTFRAKPVVKRDHRPAWEAQDRRNFYLNLGFGLIVGLSLLILAIYVGLTWYNAHLASVGSVDGQSITKDEFLLAYRELAEAGVPVRPDPEECWVAYGGWRVNYDTALLGLAAVTMAPTSPWSSDRSPAFRSPLLRRRR